MRLVCLSDTHMCHRGLSLPDGDVLLHAGDATSRGTSDEVSHFLDWFASQPHQHKVLIAGNHDRLYQRHPDMARQLLADHPEITYLEDSGAEIGGLSFWGSPWQPWFCDWAFNLPRRGEALREVWNKIPIETDVLITHGPPFRVLDQVNGGEHLGCEELMLRMMAVKPKVHIFGHIHDGYGIAQSSVTTHVNASICDEDYKPINRPIVLDITPNAVEVHGIKPSARKERLDALKATIDTISGPMTQVQSWVQEGHLVAMKEIADLRGVTMEALVKDYFIRGLLSDMAKLHRAEAKPAKRTVPFVHLAED